MEGATTSATPSTGNANAQQNSGVFNESHTQGQEAKQVKRVAKSKSPQPAIEEGAYPKEGQQGESKAKQAYKLVKVDGQEYEVDESKYHEAAQKSFAADKRIWEANQLHKQALAKLAEAEEKAAKYQDYEKKPPTELFKEIQQKLKDPNTTKEFRKAAEDWLYQQIQGDGASPEQKRIAQLEAEVAEARAAKEAEEKQKAEEAKKQELQGYRQSAQESILNVLKMSNLPATEAMVKAIADIKYNAARAKVKLSDEQVANILKTDTMESSNALYGDFANQIIQAKSSGDVDAIIRSGEALMSTLPEGIIKALRIYDLAKHSQSRGQTIKKEEPAMQGEQSKGVGAYNMSWDEFQEYEKKRLG